MKSSRNLVILLFICTAFLLASCSATSPLQAPGVTLNVDPANGQPQDVP